MIPISTQLSLRNWYIDESTKEKVFGDETKFYLAKKDLNFKHKRAKGVFHLYDMNGKLVLLQTSNLYSGPNTYTDEELFLGLRNRDGKNGPKLLVFPLYDLDQDT